MFFHPLDSAAGVASPLAPADVHVVSMVGTRGTLPPRPSYAFRAWHLHRVNVTLHDLYLYAPTPIRNKFYCSGTRFKN